MSNPINEDGKLDGVYAYYYGNYQQKFYARVLGNRYTVGYGSPESAAAAPTMFDMEAYEVGKISSRRWMKVDSGQDLVAGGGVW